jgi:RNA 2',3'-cyclic 3'-phosphodiesterase
MTSDETVWRTFFALRLEASPALQDALRSLGRWSHAVRPVAPDQLHVTVRFLGDTEPDLAATLIEALSQPIAEVDALSLVLRGVGTFSARGRLSVVWVGLEPHPSFQRLRTQLDTVLHQHGVPPDDRPFRPHLTVGRFKTGGRFKAAPPVQMLRWLDSQRDTSFGTFSVSELEYLRSELTTRGPIHTVLDRFPLRSDG